MTDDSGVIQQQALEAIKCDVVSFWSLFENARRHSQSALLLHGVVSLASMFVVESYQCLVRMFPLLQDVLFVDHVDLLRESRHRAKLLDDAEKTLVEVAGEMVMIAQEQRRLFLEPHTGFLGPLKRWIQPDLGLSTYDGHVFSTTHATVFGFGQGYDFEVSAFSFGESIGAYIASLIEMFQLQTLPLSSSSVLPGKMEMKDIKYEALYRRGPFRTVRMDCAAGMTLLLANLNYTHYILRELLPSGSQTLFRFKFLVAFHANSSLKMIQDSLMGEGSLSKEAHGIFSQVLGNADSRWLRKRGSLRNLLTHYLADQRLTKVMSSGTTRVQAIEHLSGNLDYEEIDTLLDRHIARMSRMLEMGFCLSGDFFWYGRVS